MFLSNLRLKFARDLIAHWLDIRRGALVPLDADLDPRELLRCFEYIAIANLTKPAHVVFELAGPGLRRRFGRDIRHVNWVELVPPRLGRSGMRARERVRAVPCGFYHQFTLAREGASAVTVETLVLPLRHQTAAVPHAVIGISHDSGAASDSPAGWLTPSARIEHYVCEFVDIGAGVSFEE